MHRPACVLMWTAQFFSRAVIGLLLRSHKGQGSICGSVLPQRKHADSAQHPLSSDAGDASILCLVGRPDLETGIEGTVHIREKMSQP
ncbi:Iggfc-Binding Protein [Manis pentadactyla]|nr:Iggfc-Binding Protein [Manis pentadactyla]